jgi:hypothetical protein
MLYSTLKTIRRGGIKNSLPLFFLLATSFTWGQKSMPEETLLAQDELLGVKVILVSDCEQQKSNYYVVHKSDTLQFMYFAACKVMQPFENKEAFKIGSKQVDKKGPPELILEYEYNNRGFHKELIVIQLDELKLLFKTELEAYGQHVYGEELGDYYGFTNKIYFKKNGTILLKKPVNNSKKWKKERYRLVDGKYSLVRSN